MAAPFVSGMAALIKSQNLDMSLEDLRGKLLENTYDLGEKGKDMAYSSGLTTSSKIAGESSAPLYRKVLGDSLESNNAYTLAKSYTASSIIKGNIYPQQDIDWYKFFVPSGTKGTVKFDSPSTCKVGINHFLFIIF